MSIIKMLKVCFLGFVAFALLVSCDNPFEDPNSTQSEPTGHILLTEDDKTLSVIASATESLRIRISSAEHSEYGTGLTYRVYYSTSSALDTIENMRAHGTLAVSGSEEQIDDGYYSSWMEVPLSALAPLQRYTVNAYVEDDHGQTAVYHPLTAETIGDGDASGIIATGESVAYTVDLFADNSMTFQHRLEDAKDIYVAHANIGSYSKDTPITVLDSRSPHGSWKEPVVRIPDGIAASNRSLGLRAVQLPPARLPLLNEKQSSLQSGEVVGSTAGLFVEDGASCTEVPATLRHMRTVDGTTVKIWVADDSWIDGGSRTNLVDEEMVTALADRYLQAGDANDIVDLVTNIYGKPWGAHPYIDLIPATDTIDILLYDIGSDNSTSGGAAGYFWAKDNFYRTASTGTPTDYSNERIMVYIDSVLFAQKEDGGWDVDDVWPQLLISTLVHEFQHMIHFYQRPVSRDLTSEVWYNEMLSMATEDAVAGSLQLPGPRGVYTPDGSPGTPGMQTGRIPYFNVYPETPFRTWLPSDPDANGIPYVLRSYSLHYVLGAYLLRTHGGVQVLRQLMYEDHDGDGDEWDLAWASRDPYGYLGYDELFTNVIAATLLSNRTDVPAQYNFNNGGWFESSLDGITYPVGSINFYNYELFGIVGPYSYESQELDALGFIPANSVVIEELGMRQPGLLDVNINTRDNSYPTAALVFRDHE
jgi:hypothetical protein